MATTTLLKEKIYIVKELEAYSTPWLQIKSQYAEASKQYTREASQPPRPGQDPREIQRQAEFNFKMTCDNIASYYNSIADTCPIPITFDGKSKFYDEDNIGYILLQDPFSRTATIDNPNPISPSIDNMLYKVPLSTRTTLRTTIQNWSN